MVIDEKLYIRTGELELTFTPRVDQSGNNTAQAGDHEIAVVSNLTDAAAKILKTANPLTKAR